MWVKLERAGGEEGGREKDIITVYDRRNESRISKVREGRKDGRRGWKRVGPARSPPRVPETFSNLFNLGPWCVSESYLRECKIKQSDKQSFHLRLARNRFSVHLPFSFGLAGFESSQTCLRVGARLRPLHRCFDVCTQHHRVTLQVFMRRIFFSPPFCLLLSLSVTLFSHSSPLLHFFPRSRFRCASLLIATEYDPPSLSL